MATDLDMGLDGVRRGIRHHLITGLTYRETSKDPKGNGYTFAEVPDWQLRDWFEAIDAAIAAQEQARA